MLALDIESFDVLVERVSRSVANRRTEELYRMFVAAQGGNKDVQRVAAALSGKTDAPAEPAGPGLADLLNGARS